jgi:hypothetical protein
MIDRFENLKLCLFSRTMMPYIISASALALSLLALFGAVHYHWPGKRPKRSESPGNRR